MATMYPLVLFILACLLGIIWLVVSLVLSMARLWGKWSERDYWRKVWRGAWRATRDDLKNAWRERWGRAGLVLPSFAAWAMTFLVLPASDRPERLMNALIGSMVAVFVYCGTALLWLVASLHRTPGRLAYEAEQKSRKQESLLKEEVQELQRKLEKFQRSTPYLQVRVYEDQRGLWPDIPVMDEDIERNALNAPSLAIVEVENSPPQGIPGSSAKALIATVSCFHGDGQLVHSPKSGLWVKIEGVNSQYPDGFYSDDRSETVDVTPGRRRLLAIAITYVGRPGAGWLRYAGARGWLLDYHSPDDAKWINTANALPSDVQIYFRVHFRSENFDRVEWIQVHIPAPKGRLTCVAVPCPPFEAPVSS